MDVSRVSQLKVWSIQNLGAGKLGITCPSCGEKAVVRGARWRKALAGGTRGCAYCGKWAWISAKRKEDQR